MARSKPTPAPTIQELLDAKPIGPAESDALLQGCGQGEPQAAVAQTKSDPAAAVPLPKAEEPTKKTTRWRVALKDVKVMVRDELERTTYQDYLDVDAASEWEACVAFAAYNGIPLTVDALESKPKLASIHKPVVEPLN